MSAAPAYQPQQVHIPGGWFHCPNAVADKLPLLIPAERSYVLIAYRWGKNGEPAVVTDALWADKAQMTGQSRRNVERGLAEKKWLDPKSGRLDPRGFIGWARHADPEHTRTAGRGPSTPIPAESAWVSQAGVEALVAAKVKESAKLHPECESGCAVADGRAELISVSPLSASQKTKPVLPSVQDDVQRGADTAEPLPPGPTPSGSGPGVKADGPTLREDPEVKWAKTLAVMRSELVDAGVSLLLRILAVIVSFGTVSDGVLAQAIRIAVRKRGRAIDSIGSILLVNLVPEVLAAMRHQGRKLDAEPVEHAPQWTEEHAAELRASLDEQAEAARRGREHAELERVASEEKAARFTADNGRARRIKADYEAGLKRWGEADVAWAMDFLWRNRGGPS